MADSKKRDETVPNRGNWSKKCDYILSCIGFSVSLGSVWRFPYVVYSNGGGAFLVPYTIMLLLAGIPLFFFEVSRGQYSSGGPVAVWNASPMFRGIGFGMVVISSIVGIYYNVITSYGIYYMFASFTSNLPWETCDHDYNTEFCTLKYDDCLSKPGYIMIETECQNISSLAKTEDELNELNIFKEGNLWNTSAYVDVYGDNRKRPTEEYWKHAVLRQSSSLTETGELVWKLALCLLATWIIVFLCLVKGVKSSGKVVYFTATFPYVVLFALLIRGVTLDGAMDGIEFFINPKWEDITKPQVWLNATSQAMFSQSTAVGGLITLSSYNRFNNNCYFDSLVVSVANFVTSALAGFAIFSVLGHVALLQNKPVPEVVDSGFGLVFIVYPEGLSLLPGSTFWAIVFFMMLINLGLNCEFGLIQTVVTAINDRFPGQLRNKELVTFIVCLTGFLLGLVCVTQAGPYWVSLLDSYVLSIGLIMLGFLELVAISWVYGIKRFTNDIRSMLGDGRLFRFPLFLWWQLNWTVITPSLLLFVMLYNWMNWSEPTYNDELYPVWGRIVGWIIIGLTLIFIPLVMIYEFVKANGGSVADRWRVMSRPTAEWGPQLPTNRQQAWQMHTFYDTTMGGNVDIG